MESSIILKRLIVKRLINFERGGELNASSYSAIGALKKYDLLRRIYVQGRARDVQMHRGQYPILRFIIENGGCTQAEAAEFLGVSQASVACSVKRMLSAGLISRSGDESDLRRYRLRASEAGIEAFNAMRSIMDEADERTFAGFSKEEKETLIAFFERMSNNIAGGNGAERSIPELARELTEMVEKG